MQNKQLYGVMIPRLALLELVSGINSNISTHSLGGWLKSQTNSEYVVLPRDFVIALIDVLESLSYTDQVKALIANWDFEEIRGTWL